MLAIMGVAVDERAPPGFAGLVIGLTLGGIITVTGNIAGASLNPARTFGPFLMDMLLGGSNLWAFFPIYIIGPVIGAVLAAVFYDQVTAD
jgi:glycerol uptake facilitator protein